jgi:hypothetical protein
MPAVVQRSSIAASPKSARLTCGWCGILSLYAGNAVLNRKTRQRSLRGVTIDTATRTGAYGFCTWRYPGAGLTIPVPRPPLLKQREHDCRCRVEDANTMFRP